MSDMISGVVGQMFQKILENKNLQQQQTQTQNGRSFESYLQQNGGTQTPTGDKTVTQTQTVEKTTSGADMQTKLDQMQAELANKFKEQNQDQNKINKISSTKFIISRIRRPVTF